jgi:hypothetical protein
MNAKQYAALEDSIQAWVDGWCEHVDWPDVVVGQRTVEHMAVAARAVFDACEESQQYAEREGFRATTAWKG